MRKPYARKVSSSCQKNECEFNANEILIEKITALLSDATDGQVENGRLSNKKCLQTIQAHNGPVNDISFDASVAEEIYGDIPLQFVPQSISHLYESTDFAIAGNGICYWNC
uniref:Uncharacterized protein n=1 Tax=Panagrolaimus davidi TaxID=227884 RepID=A0A914Q6N0_9BILA